MTVSNSHVFTMTRDEIIIEMLELTGTHDLGNTPDAAVVESCARTLNLFLKSWQPKGLFLHTYKSATLFLAKDQQSYLLGPTGDNATESYVETTLTADSAATDTVLTVTSETGMTVGDYIGVVLDDNSLFWDTIASLAPLTLTNGITSAASTGNAVFTYTTKIIRPLTITDVQLLSGGSERPLNKTSLSEYKLLANKDTSSVPNNYAYDPQLDNAILYVWPTASDANDKINFSYKKPVDDFTADSDTATAPADWLQCLTLGGAYHISPKRMLSISDQQALKARFEDALADLDDFEETSIFFSPGR